MGAAWGPGWGRPAALRHLVVREKRSAAVTGDLTVKPLEAKTRVTVLRLAARGLQGCTDIRATRKGKPRADTPTGSLLGFCLDGRHLGFYSNYSTELSVAATSKGRRGLGNTSPRVGLYFCSWGSRGGWGLLRPLLPRWSPTAALGLHFWTEPHGWSCPVFPISPVGFASRRMLTVSASEYSHN